MLSEANWLSPFVDQFPGDLSKEKSPRQTLGCLYSLVEPSKTKHSKVLAWSEDLASQFLLERPESEDKDAKLLTGNYITKEMKSFSYCYGAISLVTGQGSLEMVGPLFWASL